MDRYQVWLKANHEITQFSKELPRTYRLEETQKRMNETYEITSTSGKNMSAQTSLVKELQKDRRLNHLETNNALVSFSNLFTFRKETILLP